MLKFGTDGIRGITGKDLDFETIYKLGCVLGESKSKILLSKDNRMSSEYISMLFCSGVLSRGGNVTDVGFLGTAGLSYLLNNNYTYGVMITASHNPPEYNGIKIFDSDGKKLSIEREKEIEKLMEKDFSASESFGRYRIGIHLKEKYFNYLKTFYCNLKNVKLLLDTSNGVTSYYAKSIFEYYGATVINVNDKFNGEIINENSGILNDEILSDNKEKNNCDFAIAFDGDGDRVKIIDKYNNILDGDYILYIMTNYLRQYKTINQVVGTVHTNLGIEKTLNSMGVNLIRSDVGDKNVIVDMIENNCIIGAEQSGHIIFSEYLKTGDGILSAILCLNAINYYEKSNRYIELIDNIKIMPQVNINYSFIDSNILDNENVKNLIKQLNSLYSRDYRILVRKSGSENKIRIMIEGVNKLTCTTLAKNIFEELKNNDKLQ